MDFIVIILVPILWVMCGAGVRVLLDVAGIKPSHSKLLIVTWPIILIVISIIPLSGWMKHDG